MWDIVEHTYCCGWGCSLPLECWVSTFFSSLQTSDFVWIHIEGSGPEWYTSCLTFPCSALVVTPIWAERVCLLSDIPLFLLWWSLLSEQRGCVFCLTLPCSALMVTPIWAERVSDYPVFCFDGHSYLSREGVSSVWLSLVLLWWSLLSEQRGCLTLPCSALMVTPIWAERVCLLSDSPLFCFDGHSYLSREGVSSVWLSLLLWWSLLSEQRGCVFCLILPCSALVVTPVWAERVCLLSDYPLFCLGGHSYLSREGVSSVWLSLVLLGWSLISEQRGCVFCLTIPCSAWVVTHIWTERVCLLSDYPLFCLGGHSYLSREGVSSVWLSLVLLGWSLISEQRGCVFCLTLPCSCFGGHSYLSREGVSSVWHSPVSAWVVTHIWAERVCLLSVSPLCCFGDHSYLSREG